MAIGKPAKITDLSMNQNYEARVMEADGQRLGDNAFLDLTDRQVSQDRPLCRILYFTKQVTLPRFRTTNLSMLTNRETKREWKLHIWNDM